VNDDEVWALIQAAHANAIAVLTATLAEDYEARDLILAAAPDSRVLTCTLATWLVEALERHHAHHPACCPPASELLQRIGAAIAEAER
jgi:hypothetical protein